MDTPSVFHPGECDSTIKWKEKLAHATSLDEPWKYAKRHQTQKATYFLLSLVWQIQNRQIHRSRKQKPGMFPQRPFLCPALFCHFCLFHRRACHLCGLSQSLGGLGRCQAGGGREAWGPAAPSASSVCGTPSSPISILSGAALEASDPTYSAVWCIVILCSLFSTNTASLWLKPWRCFWSGPFSRLSTSEFQVVFRKSPSFGSHAMLLEAV